MQFVSKELHLRNLPLECTEGKHLGLEKPFGKIANTMSDANISQASPKLALIQFADVDTAAAARYALDGRIIQRCSRQECISYSAPTDLNIDFQAHCGRNMIISDLTRLMSCLNLSVDSHQFSCFYDFVFLVLCENGQKNITVNRAVTAWRIVLAGRFRLLSQWCSFVEKHQHHNITADTWQQVLAFSRCVNEDLDGYDPKGAWPVLIDDFVEHMYRINQSKSSSAEVFCNCSDMQVESGLSTTFHGLNLLPGSKRKDFSGSNECHEKTDLCLINKPKRSRGSLDLSRRGCWDSNIVEDCLVKGFEGRLLIGCSFQFEYKG